ncbi:hypothetical protein KNE206_52880 [Kitasatospora sp. NE20-6]|uniref:phosphoribosyltransferase n=1 Tax=Kitasatospora sp. NE20-6 TaxID=2859066 RepID=UPI0034DC8642
MTTSPAPRPAAGLRVFTRTAAFAPTASQCIDAAWLLAESAIGTHPGPVARVIAIANGGTRPATVIAEYLKVPRFTVLARHNTGPEPWQQATGRVTVELPADLPTRLKGRTLLVDDIAGSGATFTAVREALADRLPTSASLECAALCCNTGTAVQPDRWIWDVDDWVHFPWEPPHDGPTRPMPISFQVKVPARA